MTKIAVAVSAALLAGSALAANVDLYGVVNTGFAYTNTRSVEDGAVTKSKSFSMESGSWSGSRWGLRGSEDLGNGYKVGFVLESGFNSDSGTQGQGRLFGRESTLYVSGGFGTVYAGRMGSMISDVGSVGWYSGMASPFGTGVGDTEGHAAVMSVKARVDNAIAYMSPRFGGLQFSVQYAMGDGGTENKSGNDRYWAIGADYQAGNLEIGALIDYTNKRSTLLSSTEKESSVESINRDDIADAVTFNLAANYDCGFAKSFIAFQYFKDVSQLHWHDLDSYYGRDETTNKINEDRRLDTLKGFGVNLGVDVPAFGGDFLASVGYGDGDLRNAKKKIGDFKVYSALVGYEYPFSKRTYVYTSAGYTYEKNKKDSGVKKDKTFQALAGLVHKF